MAALVTQKRRGFSYSNSIWSPTLRRQEPPIQRQSKTFVKTLKRDYVRVNPLPDAETVLSLLRDWIEDSKKSHPHSGLKWKPPREFIRAKIETDWVYGE